MPREQGKVRGDLGADGLGHTEHHATRERAPQRAETADDDRLEGEQDGELTLEGVTPPCRIV